MEAYNQLHALATLPLREEPYDTHFIPAWDGNEKIPADPGNSTLDIQPEACNYCASPVHITHSTIQNYSPALMAQASS